MVLWTIGREREPTALEKEAREEQESFHSEAINQNDELAPGSSLVLLDDSWPFNLFGIRKEETKLKPLLLKSSKRLGYKTQRLLGGYNIDREQQKMMLLQLDKIEFPKIILIEIHC